MRGERFARQLKLLALLEGRPEGVEIEEAAGELGTRRRTVHRDFRLLEDAGCPLTSEARYRSRRARGRRGTQRKLGPYHLRVAEEGIYLLARCHRSGAMKTFLVDRFDEVRPTAERFTPPEGFSAEQMLRPSFGMWSGRPRKVRFTVARPGLEGETRWKAGTAR